MACAAGEVLRPGRPRREVSFAALTRRALAGLGSPPVTTTCVVAAVGAPFEWPPIECHGGRTWHSGQNAVPRGGGVRGSPRGAVERLPAPDMRRGGVTDPTTAVRRRQAAGCRNPGHLPSPRPVPRPCHGVSAERHPRGVFLDCRPHLWHMRSQRGGFIGHSGANVAGEG